MPNDCWNNITLVADKEELEKFIKEECKDVPEWAYKVEQKGVEGIVFHVWSPWKPNFEWLEGLLTKYPSIWLKNEWREEGGTAGVWVGTIRKGTKDIKRLEWEDLCIEELHMRFRSESK